MAIASSSQTAAPGSEMDPLEQLATANTYSLSWPELHSRLVARLNSIIDYFPTSPPTSLEPQPDPLSASPRSSPIGPSSDLTPSTIGGLIIPPFPPLIPGRRKSASPITSLPTPPSPVGRGNGLVRANGHLSMMANRAVSGNLFEDAWDPEVVIGGKMQPGLMNRDEGKKEVERVGEILKDMDGPPFTLQRIAELLHDPRKQHSNLGKFLRALEKNLLVTSPYEVPSYEPPPPLLTNMIRGRDDTMPPGSTTPMFSPIPFLPTTHPGLGMETGMPNGGGKIEEGLMSPLTLDHGFTAGRSPTPEPEGSISTPRAMDSSISSVNGATPSNTTPTASTASDPAHQPYLGRVDELDTGPLPPGGVNGDAHGAVDESGGGGEGGNMTLHGMSDRPVPISGTMSPEGERRIAHMPSRRSLPDRFVSGGTADAVRAEASTAESAGLEEGDTEMGGSQESN